MKEEVILYIACIAKKRPCALPSSWSSSHASDSLSVGSALWIIWSNWSIFSCVHYITTKLCHMKGPLVLLLMTASTFY